MGYNIEGMTLFYKNDVIFRKIMPKNYFIEITKDMVRQIKAFRVRKGIPPGQLLNHRNRRKFFENETDQTKRRHIERWVRQKPNEYQFVRHDLKLEIDAKLKKEYEDSGDFISSHKPFVNIAFVIYFYLDAFNNVYDTKPQDVSTTLYRINIWNE